MAVKHRCTAQDVGWDNGRYESGGTRNERRQSRVDYLAGKCTVCDRPHLAVVKGTDRSAVLDIRRHVAWWYRDKFFPTVGVKVWWQ